MDWEFVKPCGELYVVEHLHYVKNVEIVWSEKLIDLNWYVKCAWITSQINYYFVIEDLKTILADKKITAWFNWE